VTQPLDRSCQISNVGEIDQEKGEFWVENPFLMIGQGKNLSAFERNCLFLNLQGEGFLDASFTSDVDLEADSRSPIAADFDRDGDLDLLVGSVGGGPIRLFLNQTPQQNRILLKLEGVKSNRSAIGSRVEIYCGGRTIYRELFPSNGFMGLGPADWLVGIGNAEKIDTLTIRWPSGETQKFSNLPVNKTISIREGDQKFQTANLVN